MTKLSTLVGRAAKKLAYRFPCPQWCKSVYKRHHEILIEEQGTTTRFFFGLATALMGVFYMASETVHSPLSEYALMLVLAPDWVWGLGFILNGVSMYYGAYTNRSNSKMLFLEGVLGVIVWTASAYCVTKTQGTPGGHMAGAIIALWVYVRHPEVKKAQ